MSATSTAEALETEHEEPQDQAVASTFLFGFWYRALQGQRWGDASW